MCEGLSHLSRATHNWHDGQTSKNAVVFLEKALKKKKKKALGLSGLLSSAIRHKKEKGRRGER